MPAPSPWQKYIDAAAGGGTSGLRPTEHSAARPWLSRTIFPHSGRGSTDRKACPNRRSPTDGPAPYRDLRLLPVGLAAWIAAALTPRIDPVVGIFFASAAALCTLLLLVAVARFRGVPPAFLLLVLPLAVMAVVGASVLMQAGSRAAGPIQAAVNDSADIVGELHAVSDATEIAAGPWGGPQFQVKAQLGHAIGSGTEYNSNALMLIIGDTAWKDVSFGDDIRVPGRLGPPPTGSRYTGLFYPSALPHIVPGTGWYAATAGMRATFRTSAEGFGPDIAGLLPGMVLGDRSSLGDDLETAMKGTGLTHLTAVSGSNCAFVLAFTFLCCRQFRAHRTVAMVAGLAVLAGFVALVRPDPSVLRAAAMGSLGAFAILTGRGRLSFALLQLAIVVLLVFDPWLYGEYGFILSVLATAGLILTGPTIIGALEHFLPRALALILSIPIAAQLFCTPVLLTLNPDLPTYSIPANVAASPVVPLITILGMIAVLLGSLHPALAAPMIVVSAMATDWVARVARFFFGLPGAALPWVAGPTGIALAVACAGAVVAVFAWLKARSRRDGSGQDSGHDSRHDRLVWRTGILRLAAACLTAGIVAGAGTVLLFPGLGQHLPGVEKRTTADWDAAACDVGQGDGFVVRSGPSSAVVIDAGPEPGLMDQCLVALGVSTVDLLVITHSHADHYGGVPGVLHNRKVVEIAYSSADGEPPPPVQKARTSIPVRRLARGDHGSTTGKHAADKSIADITWQVLWPDSKTAGAEENNASAVVLVTVPEQKSGPPQKRQQVQGSALRILFTGDVEEDAATRLLAANPELAAGSVDVLKVAHHGAANGGTAILEALSPPVALISVGAENTYGHPGSVILHSLATLQTRVFRTDQLGTFTLNLEGSLLEIARP